MDFLHCAADNWFTFLQSAGIIGSLLFAGIGLHSEARTRRVANLLTVTSNHREVWTELYRRPELRRVLEVKVDLQSKPVSIEEEIFVVLVILHVASVFEALKGDLLIAQEGFRRDVWWIFSRPIPRAVWERIKVLQNDDFAAFVEQCLNWK